jgi:uncharacterized protein (UPF0332 family)
MNAQQQKIIVKSWFEKADAVMQDARLLFQNGRLASCVNRLYYAVFYSASAVLVSQGKKYGKHSAVRSAVHRDFINTGLLDKEYGRMYDILLSRREQSDYQPLTAFSMDEVEMFLIKATEIVEAFKRIIGK